MRDASGLTYLRARYLSTQVGRFITRDPWGGDTDQPMSYNAWLYAYADPMMLTDASGRNSCEGQSRWMCQQIVSTLLAVYVANLQAQQNIQYTLGAYAAGAQYEFLNNESLGITGAVDPYC
jgi:RHS repeat-associated protein